jgi:hypothetical protein
VIDSALAFQDSLGDDPRRHAESALSREPPHLGCCDLRRLLAGWTETGFSTRGWDTGRAQLGYGEGDEATAACG